MAQVIVFRSGDWHNVSDSSSPWWTGTTYVTASPDDDVWTNNFSLTANSNITVKSLTNDSRSSTSDWKHGATTAATAGGGLTIPTNSNYVFIGNITHGATTNTIFNHTGNGNLTINGTINGAPGTGSGNTLVTSTTGIVTLQGGSIYARHTGGSSGNTVIINSASNTIINATDITYTGSNYWSSNITHNSTGSITVVATNIGASVSNSGNGIVITAANSINITAATITSGAVGQAIRIPSGNANINITCGNITGNSSISNTSGRAIFISSASTTTLIGNVVGGTLNSIGPTVEYTTAAPLMYYGNITGGSGTGGTGLSYGTTSTVRFFGNAIGGTNASGIVGTGGTLLISGNILNASNGVQAIYAPSYRIDPVPTNSFIRYARNGTGVGSDAWLYQFTTDSLSAFSMPPISAVRAGVSYANNTLTGICNVPSPNSVAFGVPVDNTVGTAFLNGTDASVGLFNVPVASLTATNSLGARLRNSATVESIGRIIESTSLT